MINNNKTKNNFSNNNNYTYQKKRRSEYISRSTNKKINSNTNNKNETNNKTKEKFKKSSTLMEMNYLKNNNIRKCPSEFSENNSIYNLIPKTQNKNMNNIKPVSIPKSKNWIQENSGNNSSLVFNIYEDMKIKNRNTAISANKKNSKQNISNIEKKINYKNQNLNNKELDNKNNNLNIQKYSVKQNYDKNYLKYINSNNNSKEEKSSDKNRNNFNRNGSNHHYNNNDMILDLNANNYVTFNKNKNNINNNKVILQKILTNLFSSNKKKVNNNNVKKDNNMRENKFINNESPNKISTKKYNNNNNYFNNENVNIDKRKVTPKLKANNNNTKKISGLFSANHKEKECNIITDVCDSKSKKIIENIAKRNLSINIHNNNIRECKFKTSINVEIFNKKLENNIPKLNLNQVFNLKLCDKTKMSNNDDCNNNYYSNDNVIAKKEKNCKENNNNINLKNEILYFLENNNDILKNKLNNYNSNMIQNYNKKVDQNLNTINKKSVNKKNKFNQKDVYNKDLRKSHLQRFFSYSKEKTNINNNVNLMNNIKKINFNDNKKSPLKNSTRRNVRSNDNKNYHNTGEIKHINNLNNKKKSSSKFKKGKEIIGDSYINLRKRRNRYSDINKIIETNNLKCMKFINNSEINDLNKHNNNFIKNDNNIKDNNLRRSNHSASHNNLNNNKGKYEISRIGNIFKPTFDNKIRGSYKESKRKRQSNLDLLSSKANKTNNNYSSSKRHNKKNECYKSIKKKNIYNGIYESSKKENNYNTQNINNQIKFEDMFGINHNINENLVQNSLTMYSIYILSKYFETCDKIGISKITLYDINKNPIPIEYSNTSDGISVDYVFDMNPDLNKDEKTNNIPLIAIFKQNFCINFHIKNIYDSSFSYIYINNYSDVNDGISPINQIKILKSNTLLYKGFLKLSNSNIIKITNNINDNDKGKLTIKDLATEKNNNLNNNGKSLTFTIFKSLIRDNTDNNDNIMINKYNSARNTFNSNNYNKYSEDNNIYNENNDKNNNNDFSSNSYMYNNEKENINSDNLLFFQSNFSKTFKDLSKTSSYNLNYFTNDFNSNIQNENEYHFSQTLKFPDYPNKLFLNSNNSAFDDCHNLFRTSAGYVNNREDLENYSNKNDDNLNIDYHHNFLLEKKYIEFNKISIYLKSNYGHKKFIGLTGIIFFDEKNEPIDIEKASAIGALPKDLRTIYNDDSDNRIFENIFNGINNTNDTDNMWVTKFKNHEFPPYMELYFEEKIKLSKIIIYNYNQVNKLEIGTRIIDLYFDNYYYKTIYLIQGTGEVANIDNENNMNDFGQEICFSNELENFDINNKLSTRLTLNDKEENPDIKYASILFEQSYETPYIPKGNIIKIQFLTYYHNEKNENNNINNINNNEIYLGIKNIEIFNEEGIDIINNNNEIKRNKYKKISNRKMEKNNKNIIIKGIYNEEENNNKVFDFENNLFYIFDKFVKISYIKFTPIDNNIKNFENKCLYKIKEVKIFCDDKIIFEGILYNNKPTIILFTCEDKIIKDINRNYLTKYIKKRKIQEFKTNTCCSLVLS